MSLGPCLLLSGGVFKRFAHDQCSRDGGPAITGPLALRRPPARSDSCLPAVDTAERRDTTGGVAENGYSELMRFRGGRVGSENARGSRLAKVLRGRLAHLGRGHGRGGPDVAAASSRGR